MLSQVTILNEDVLLLLLNYSANYRKHLAANLTPNLRTLPLTNCKTLIQGKLCLYIFQCLCNTIATISFQISFLTLPMLQLALLLKWRTQLKKQWRSRFLGFCLFTSFSDWLLEQFHQKINSIETDQVHSDKINYYCHLYSHYHQCSVREIILACIIMLWFTDIVNIKVHLHPKKLYILVKFSLAPFRNTL